LSPPIVIVALGRSVPELPGVAAVTAGASNLIWSAAVARIDETVTYAAALAPLHSLGAHRSAVDDDHAAV
jgi:hypothetical protein